MFNFTTTNVINTNLDSSGKDLWIADAGKSFNVLRVNNFKKENVEAVYKAVATEPKLEKVEIDFSQIEGAEKGDQYRLNIYIGLTQASQDSRYSNDMIYKGKPFTVEFLWKDSAADTLKALKKTIDKYQLLVYGDKQLDATTDGDDTTAGTKLTISAKTEYQRFKTVDIDKYTPDPTTYPYSGQYTPVLNLESDGVTLTPGKESFGTYSYILHNLRLPTTEHTRYMSVNDGEMPIVGAMYNQYTIRYCVNRGPLGLNAVGDSVKSVTTHVFYVKSDLTEKFEQDLTSALGITFAPEKREGEPLKGEPRAGGQLEASEESKD